MSASVIEIIWEIFLFYFINSQFFFEQSLNIFLLMISITIPFNKKMIRNSEKSETTPNFYEL
jgi:hypothetical protein